VLTETPPPDTVLGTVTPSQGSCTRTSMIVCHRGDLAPGASATVSVQVTSPSSDTPLASTMSESCRQALAWRGSSTGACDRNSNASQGLVPVSSPVSKIAIAPTAIGG
jgi:hypothetical protein